MQQDTSIRVYEDEVKPTLGERQKKVRELLLIYPTGLSNAEIGQHLGWEINRVTPRSNELVKMGVVIEAGKRQCTVTGRTVHTWKLAINPSKFPPAYTTAKSEPPQTQSLFAGVRPEEV